MPVVINEFEVVDTEPPARLPQREASLPAPAALPDPEDLRRRLEAQAEQTLRLWAH